MKPAETFLGRARFQPQENILRVLSIRNRAQFELVRKRTKERKRESIKDGGSINTSDIPHRLIPQLTSHRRGAVK